MTGIKTKSREKNRKGLFGKKLTNLLNLIHRCGFCREHVKGKRGALHTEKAGRLVIATQLMVAFQYYLKHTYHLLKKGQTRIPK